MVHEHSKKRALCYFRCLVYALYREARHLGEGTPGRHPQYWEKVRERWPAFVALFDGMAKCEALVIYRQEMKPQSEPEGITAPLRRRSGLDLEDVRALFAEGRWFGGYGGPKWAAIADAALQLRDAIDRQDWDQTGMICDRVREMKHNSGYLVDHLKYGGSKWPEDCGG